MTVPLRQLHPEPLATESDPLQWVIASAREGRPFVVIDDTAASPTGYLMAAGGSADARVINFMATRACGVVCLAITPQRARQLGLQPMSPIQGNKGKIDCTVSIEARVGVTTGISASDRALTVAAAVRREARPHDLVSPGHVFPLVARSRGVLDAPGPIEAGVDLVRMAGAEPAAVMCAIMDDDGAVACGAYLESFVGLHGLACCDVSDVQRHRQLTEGGVEVVGERQLSEADGWHARVYRDNLWQNEHLLLWRGRLEDLAADRIHSRPLDLLEDILIGQRGGVPLARLMMCQSHVQAVLLLHSRHGGPLSARLAAGENACDAEAELVRRFILSSLASEAGLQIRA